MEWEGKKCEVRGLVGRSLRNIGRF